MACPMTKDVPLTDKQVEYFCKDGCSVICDELLKEYLKKVVKKPKKEDR